MKRWNSSCFIFSFDEHVLSWLRRHQLVFAHLLFQGRERDVAVRTVVWLWSHLRRHNLFEQLLFPLGMLKQSLVSQPPQFAWCFLCSNLSMISFVWVSSMSHSSYLSCSVSFGCCVVAWRRLPLPSWNMMGCWSGCFESLVVVVLFLEVVAVLFLGQKWLLICCSSWQ